MRWRNRSLVGGNVKTGFPYDPASPLLGIYPTELKAKTPMDIWTRMFMAALFTITKRWKRPKCPSTDERINKM